MKFTTRSIKLPAELAAIERKSALLAGCVRNISTRLDQHKATVDQDLLRDMNAFIANFQRTCHDVERLFSEWAPKLDDSSLETVKKALSSLAKDSRIKSHSEAMDKDVPLLNLSLSIVQMAGSSNPPPPGQPRDNTILCSVPHRRAGNFVSRRAVLDEIITSFAPSATPAMRVVVLQAMGGQGKTQLALEFCRDSEVEKRYSGIFWADAHDNATILNTFGALANELLPEKTFADTQARVKGVLASLKAWTAPWLIVFDNYDKPKDFNIAEFFPNSPLGSILITTRSPAVCSLGKAISLPGMTESEGLRLLLDNYDGWDDEETKKHGRLILARLGYLPLALAQANAYLRRRQGIDPISKYLEHYENSMKEVLDSTNDVSMYQDYSFSTSNRSTARTVFTTWELSISLLGESGHAEEKLAVLTVMAYFSNNSISEELFMAHFESHRRSDDMPPWMDIFQAADGSWSTEAFINIALEFKDLSLIVATERCVSEVNDNFVHLSLHPLVRDWIIHRSQQDQTQYFQRASLILAHSLLRHYWNLGEVYQLFGFRLNARETNDYLMHISVWEKLSAQKRESVRQPQRVVHYNAVDAAVRTIAVEEVFAVFLHDCQFFKRSCNILDWLCDEADLKSLALDPGDFTAPAKILRISNLVGMGSYSEARRQARTDLMRVSVNESTARARLYCTYSLATALLYTEETELTTEAEALLRELLANPEYSLSTRWQHSLKALLIEALRQRMHETDSGLTEYESIAAELLRESEVHGGPDFRHSHWPTFVWVMVIRYIRGGEHCEAFAREFMHSLDRLYPDNNLEHAIARIEVGSVYIRYGRTAEAVGLIVDALSALQGNVQGDFVLHEGHATLGEALLKLGDYSGASKALLRSVSGWLSEPEIRWVDVVGSMTSLLYCILLTSSWHDGDEMLSLSLMALDHVTMEASRIDLLVAGARCYRSMGLDGIGDPVERFKSSVQCINEAANIFLTAFQSRSQAVSDGQNVDNLETVYPYPSDAKPRKHCHEGCGCRRRIGMWFGFEVLLHKALFQTDMDGWTGSFELRHAIEAFEHNTINVDNKVVKGMAELVWAFISAPGVPAGEVTGGIRWICSNLRDRLGDSDSTKEWFEDLTRKSTLPLEYLPADEEYAAKLRNRMTAPPRKKWHLRGIRQLVSKKLHRRLEE